MSTVTTIGLDIAKSVVQVHGISASGEVLIRRQVRRATLCASLIICGVQGPRNPSRRLFGSWAPSRSG
jgi:hypothetical protein